jgi:predicted HTH transcriptional regulator
MKVSQRTIENYISDLKDKGVLHRIGHDRGGYWDIKIKF